MQGWETKMLSRADREVMVKSAPSSITQYNEFIFAS